MLAIAASAGDLECARQDRASIPTAEWGYIFYLSTSGVPEEMQAELAGVVAFVAASASREVLLERQLPQRVENSNLWRIDLRRLQWDWRDWRRVLKRYPYAPGNSYPLVIRADWLVVELTDAFSSDSYYRLLYGGRNIPKTRDQFLRFWKVDNDKTFRFGLIEGASGVSVARTRWIENRPTANRGYAWGTRDSSVIENRTDPLENLGGGFQHEAEEWIVGIPKWSETGARGALQVYFLANQKGERQERAPVSIVEDHTRFRGLAEIRNAGSCMQCHATGINEPTTNQLRALISSGVDLYAEQKLQQALERFHFSDIDKEIRRNREDFADAMRVCNGWAPEENARRFRKCVDRYDQDLTLEQAARELSLPPLELRLALAYASARNVQLGARLSALAHGRPIPRSVWEGRFHDAAAVVQLWKSKQ